MQAFDIRSTHKDRLSLVFIINASQSTERYICFLSTVLMLAMTLTLALRHSMAMKMTVNAFKESNLVCIFR